MAAAERLTGGGTDEKEFGSDIRDGEVATPKIEAETGSSDGGTGLLLVLVEAVGTGEADLGAAVKLAGGKRCTPSDSSAPDGEAGPEAPAVGEVVLTTAPPAGAVAC